MKTYVLYGVGYTERQNGVICVDDPLFATSVSEANQVASDNGGGMAMERWVIEASSPEQAMAKMAHALRSYGPNRTSEVAITMVEREGVGGEAW
jgi:hypothetical protein